MVQDTPSRKLDQYIVRFPDGMRDRLKAAAAASGRSMNAEIVFRLESSFATKGSAADKMRAIADGTFEPEPHSLDIFHADGFDPAELNKVLRGMAMRIEVLGGKLDALTDRADAQEDDADAATYETAVAATPPDQLSTDHLKPRRERAKK